MVKKISKITQGKITPLISQLMWIGADEGKYVVIQDDEGPHGPFLSVYIPTKKEDRELLKNYKNE